MEEGMVYQDEDGNMVMYGDQMMGSDEDEGHDDHHRDMMGDSYGMEGSPGDVTTCCIIHLGWSRYELR